jgi:hypothetical protein
MSFNSAVWQIRHWIILPWKHHQIITISATDVFFHHKIKVLQAYIIMGIDIVIRNLKAGIVEPDETSISRQLLDKYVSATMANSGNYYWQTVFSVCPTRRYITRKRGQLEIESMESFEMAIEDNWEQLAVAAENWIESSRVGSWQIMVESRGFSWELEVQQWREILKCVIQWDCCSSCVEIRYQDMTSEV